jgi:hypothetical protein
VYFRSVRILVFNQIITFTVTRKLSGVFVRFFIAPCNITRPNTLGDRGVVEIDHRQGKATTLLNVKQTLCL